MLLAADVGNTHTVFGLFEGEALLADFRLASLPSRTADEWGIGIRQLAQHRGVDPASVTAAALCSVVPPLTANVVEAIEKYFQVTPLVVGPGVKTGMPILYEPPQDVGADRIVNAVAAYHRHPGALIVVDFGTATTFDVISARGEYVGGAIAPGIQIGADSLFARAARLPRVELRRPPDVVGRSTVHSIQSGLYFGYASLVNGMLDRMKRELGGDVKVFVTGGLGATLAPDLDHVEAIVPGLTLEGLRLIHQKNRP
ncbi:MAG TPA: type III pantothenate kinase [Verrucomicrobiae bacterium]|nr:type III pantothenate kinase [Verrucomicrobiae bacterium]